MLLQLMIRVLKRSNFGNFQQFLKLKFLTLMILPEKSGSDLSEYTLFHIKDILYLGK